MKNLWDVEHGAAWERSPVSGRRLWTNQRAYISRLVYSPDVGAIGKIHDAIFVDCYSCTKHKKPA